MNFHNLVEIFGAAYLFVILSKIFTGGSGGHRHWKK